MTRLAVASAHGRFQPLHLGHMKYLKAAKAKCNFLWVGITQYDIRDLQDNPVDHHRTSPQDNPLTYFERVEIITEALRDEGVGKGEFGVIPFPIEAPSRLCDFLSTDVPVFTTILDEWNEHKIKVLHQAGYDVRVLYECRHHILYRGSKVRDGIRSGGIQWHKLVPSATIRAVERCELRERLLMLNCQN